MTRRLRTYTSLSTLLAFGAMALAPRLAFADDTSVAPTKTGLLLAQATPPPDPGLPPPAGQPYPPAPPPVAQPYPQTPPPAQPMPPGYYYPAPGYGQPAYPAQPPPPPAYYQPQPPRRVIVGYEERPRWGLFAGGLSMLLAAYVPTALTGVAIGNDANKLAVPIIGPLLMWQQEPYQSLNSLLLFDTLIQAGGAAMLIAGLAAKKKVPIYQNFAVAPLLSPSFAGLSAAGRF